MATMIMEMPATVEKAAHLFWVAMMNMRYFDGSRKSEAYSSLSDAEGATWVALTDAADAADITLRQLDDWLTATQGCRCSLCQDR